MAEQIAMVVALVATLRHYVPKIDGRLVPVIVLCASAAIMFASGADPNLDMLRRSLMLAIGAFGGVKVLDRGVDRLKGE